MKLEDNMSQNIFSTEGLSTWLETQPSTVRYCYTDGRRCLIYRYLAAQGVPVKFVEPGTWQDLDGVDHNYPAILNDIALFGHRNYGAALERTRTYSPND